MAPFLLRVATTGLAGAALSALAAAACSRLERGRATPALNAISHIAWGGAPPRNPGPKARNLVTGIALHTGASVFWASVFEPLLGRAARTRPTAAWAGAAATAALAYVTDYYVVTKRFRPGFEAFLSGRSLFAIYAGLAAGFALAARADAKRAQRPGLHGESDRLRHHQIEDHDERHERGHAERRPDAVIAPESGRKNSVAR